MFKLLRIFFSNNRENIKDIFSFTVTVFIVVFFVRMLIAAPFVVSGESMEPTFKNGQYLIVEKISYRINEPKRGDIVVFRLPSTSRFLIKRIMALPGESIKMDGYNVYINKNDVEDSEFFLLEEEHIKHLHSNNMERTLGENYFFLLGDNRSNSVDSRYFGPIHRNDIVGKALIRLFPFNEMKILPGQKRFD